MSDAIYWVCLGACISAAAGEIPEFEYLEFGSPESLEAYVRRVTSEVRLKASGEDVPSILPISEHIFKTIT
jgi:hypothetical protein